VVIGLISAVAVFFLGMGLYALAAPAALIRPFGITLPRPESRAEVRAVYGGFGLAIAGVLGYAALNPSAAQAILITVAVALAGMAVGRLISAVVDERTAFYPNWFYFLVEVVLAAALVFAVAL
jgi:hypothetical protein